MQERPLEGKCKEGLRKGSVRKAFGREVYGNFRKGSVRKALGREV